MYVSWRKQVLIDALRDAKQPCTCENNEDWCNSCEARSLVSQNAAAATYSEPLYESEQK
jgi:hypothetical protein